MLQSLCLCSVLLCPELLLPFQCILVFFENCSALVLSLQLSLPLLEGHLVDLMSHERLGSFLAGQSFLLTPESLLCLVEGEVSVKLLLCRTVLETMAMYPTRGTELSSNHSRHTGLHLVDDGGLADGGGHRCCLAGVEIQHTSKMLDEVVAVGVSHVKIYGVLDGCQYSAFF